MMMLLPIVSVLITYCLLCGKGKKNNVDKIHAIIYAITFNVLFLYGMTEILSLFNAINTFAIASIWGIITLFSFFILIKKRSCIRECFDFSYIRNSFSENFIFWCVIIISGIVFVLSVCIVPYNWDSMTYHIPRIMHWIQNGSVAHYACHDISQISDSPLAEFVNMHVYLLSGNTDKFLNLLQTFSYYVLIYFVYKISRRIGVSRRGGQLASLLFATIPTAFGEALMTQVDLFASIWFVFFVYLTMDLIEEERLEFTKYNLARVLFLGIIAGIAYISKPHVCIGMFVFALWLVFRCMQRKDKCNMIVSYSGIAICSAFLIASPEIIRNFITFGSFAAKESSTGFLITNFSPAYLILNCMLHIGSNMNNTFVDISGFIRKVVGKSSLILTGDSQLPQGLSMWEDINPDDYNVDLAINSVVTYIFVLALLLFLVLWIINIRKRKRLMIFQQYIVVGFVAIITFMVIVTWYRCVNRYIVGYYAVLIPAIVLVFELIARNKPQIYEAFISISMFVTLVILIPMLKYHCQMAVNSTPHFNKYFFLQGGHGQPYEGLLCDVEKNGYTHVGFICGADSFEYPIWYGLKGKVNEFRHVNVDNETMKYADNSFIPECVIVVDREMPLTMECQNIEYIREKVYYDYKEDPIICYYVIK